MNAIEIIKSVCKNTSSKDSVKHLVSKIYWELQDYLYMPYIVNDKGIEVGGMNTIWFRRDNKNGCWKAFMVVDGKNEYL